jgi:hypothetical protein
MNKIREFFKKQAGITLLAVFIFFIFILGLVIAIVVWVATSMRGGFFALPICFSNDCVKWYLGEIDQSLLIIKATVDVSVAIATSGGIFVALLSYFNTSSNAALANHIEHLKVFCEYLESEIKKRDRLSTRSIDALLLYGKIFAQSRNGKTSVSNEYKIFIKALNLIIEESNGRCVVGTPGGFSYKDHQRKIKDHLAEAGIVVYMAPRNDYFEMEEQLFSLLHRIGQSFCPPGALADIVVRNYH